MVSGSVDNTAVMWDINKGLLTLISRYVSSIHLQFNLLYFSVLVMQIHSILKNI